jgi:outer membrane lipoprotein carrier protein
MTMAGSIFAAEPNLADTLKAIENRYNNTRTLTAQFEQTVQVAGGRRSSERGTLYLSKPGKMRWEYSTPEGKLFLSDAKKIYYVSPAARRVEVSAVKETDDLRAPLAFLLGKLDFSRDFSRYEISAVQGKQRIRAFPKSEKSPYEFVEFSPGPGGVLTEVSVQSRDGSRMDYRFVEQARNTQLAGQLFQFSAPPGYEVVELRNAR